MAPDGTSVSAPLTEAFLIVGDSVLFEICSEDHFTSERWQDAVEFAVFRRTDGKSPGTAEVPQVELMLRVPLDAEHLAQVKRNAKGACFPMGGGLIRRSDRYSVEVIFGDKVIPERIADVSLQARILARLPLNAWDRALVALLGYAFALVIVGLWWATPAPRTGPRTTETAPQGDSKTVIYVAGAGLVVMGSTMIPLWGSAMGLVKGAIIASVQVVLARGLSRWRGVSLSVHRPPRWAGVLLLSMATGFLLSRSARFWMGLVPSTGTAPIETFISWPSGMLSFAALGLVLPLAEELFFRGLVYGSLLRFGRTTAFMLSYAAFVTLHVQQSMGNWGSLMAIAFTGLLLTGLRAATGTVLAPAIAHGVYNGLLTAASLG